MSIMANHRIGSVPRMVVFAARRYTIGIDILQVMLERIEKSKGTNREHYLHRPNEKSYKCDENDSENWYFTALLTVLHPKQTLAEFHTYNDNLQACK